MSTCPRLVTAHLAKMTRIVAMFALVCVAGASASGPARAQDSEPLKVVATFSILADWVQNVGGDKIELTTIVPAGGDAHTFDPNPEQVANIADADLIFEIGLGFESWLDDMYEASGSSATRVVVSEGIDLLAFDEEHADEGDDHEGKDHADEGDDHADEGDDHADEGEDHADEGDDHADEGEDHADEGDEHGHGENDPHIWGDVRNAISAVDVIANSLSEADFDNAVVYDNNAEAYATELNDLHDSIRTETQAIPEDRRQLVTTHDTFGYYAHAYEFEIVGTALGSLSTEGGDPPASDIAKLVEAIEDAGVPAIFAENVSNIDLMQTIADEAGVTLADPLYTDALSEPGSDGDTYIAMMTYNTNTIVEALSGE